MSTALPRHFLTQDVCQVVTPSVRQCIVVLMSRQTHVKPEMAPALAVRIAAEDRRRLEEIAQRENRTLSGEVRHIIARRIAEYEQEVAV